MTSKDALRNFRNLTKTDHSFYIKVILNPNRTALLKPLYSPKPEKLQMAAVWSLSSGLPKRGLKVSRYREPLWIAEVSWTTPFLLSSGASPPAQPGLFSYK